MSNMSVPMQPENVRSSLTFIVNDEKFAHEKPYELAYNPPPGFPSRNYKCHLAEVEIHDIRPIKESLTLEREGMAVVTFDSKMTPEDHFDFEKVKNVLAEEIREAVLNYLGARRLFIYECVVRKRSLEFSPTDRKTLSPEENLTQPLVFAHIDYTEETIREIVHKLCGDKANEILEKRVLALNIWKPAKGPLYDWPLTVCDLTTIEEGRDLLRLDSVETDGTIEGFVTISRPQQKWCYLSGQQPNELLLFKGADTKFGGPGAPHCSFNNPNCPPDVEPRESVEFRAIALY